MPTRQSNVVECKIRRNSTEGTVRAQKRVPVYIRQWNSHNSYAINKKHPFLCLRLSFTFSRDRIFGINQLVLKEPMISKRYWLCFLAMVTIMGNAILLQAKDTSSIARPSCMVGTHMDVYFNPDMDVCTSNAACLRLCLDHHVSCPGLCSVADEECKPDTTIFENDTIVGKNECSCIVTCNPPS